MDQGSELGTQEQAVAVAPSPLHPEIQDSGRNAVFASLVKGDTDVTGLVAYSIFKQNELDWLSEFRKAKGREPSEAESDSYIIGESTTRRLATYRHLADATLLGKGPDVATGGAAAGGVVAARVADVQPSRGFGLSTFLAIVIAAMVIVGVYFAARYGLPK